MTTTLSIAYSVELLGLQAQLVRIEAHLSGGLPQFSIVGLASGAVREARERVRAATETAGFRFPQGRLTVNLAPADLPKTSGHYDLAIALAIAAFALLTLGHVGSPRRGARGSPRRRRPR